MIKKISKNRLKEIAGLKQKKFRQSRQEVLVEGIRTLQQLADYGIRFQSLLVAESLQDKIEQFAADEYLILDEWQFSKITSTKNPQNICAVLAIKNVEMPKNGFRLYLDGIREPGNMGTIFRTASAAGISGIMLSPDCCEIYNPKVIRASMGSVFTLPSAIIEREDFIAGDDIILISLMENGTNVYQYDTLPENAVLVMGSEAFGIDKAIIERANEILTIPLSGRMESLNVAIAAGILIFTLTSKLK